MTAGDWGGRRRLALVADAPPGRLFAAEVAAALGLRGTCFVAPGNSIPDDADALFAVLTGEGADDLLALLARSAIPAVVCVTPPLIDAADAALAGSDAVLLCDPGLADAIGEVALALAPRLPGVAERDRSETLRRLGEDAARIAHALAALAGSPAPAPAVRPHPPAAAPVDAADRFRQLLRERRLRDGFFAPELFADPAWDMLLDLSAAREEGRTVSVSSLCIAAAVPPTTALRWIRALTDAGLFERVPDPDDRRRSFIGVTDRAADAMAAYLAALDRRR